MFGILPFANSVVVINGLTVPDLISALENAVGQFPGQSGGFLQISGFRFTFDTLSGRILYASLDDGTPLYRQGVVEYPGTLDLVTNSFTGAGGDGFDEFAALTQAGNSTDLGVSYADALRQYIENELGGVIAAARYPEGDLGRIIATEVRAVPAMSVYSLALMIGLFGLLGGLLPRRRG